MRAEFEGLDLNKDGFVTLEELTTTLRGKVICLCCYLIVIQSKDGNFDHTAAEEIFNDIDINGDGEVTM